MGKVVSIDQSHELIAKLATSLDWAKLDGDDIQTIITNFNSIGITEGFQKFISRMANSLTINCDVRPYEPDELMVYTHKKDKQFIWKPKHIKLCVSQKQINSSDKITGHDFLKEFANEPILNANVLDHLKDNQHLIPKDWKEDQQGTALYIFFWGTIYHDKYQRSYVRCLVFNHDKWLSRYRCLDQLWGNNSPAAIYLK